MSTATTPRRVTVRDVKRAVRRLREEGRLSEEGAEIVINAAEHHAAASDGADHERGLLLDVIAQIAWQMADREVGRPERQKGQ